MGLFDWLFGGSSRKEDTSGSMPQMHVAATPSHGMGGGSGMHVQHSAPEPAMSLAKDPVCGMDVSPEQAAATSVYEGTTYYFCASGCKAAFDRDPAMYLGKPSHGNHGGHPGHGCC